MDHPQDTFDVFVSYADADGAWVETWLIPRLKAAALSVCTERETFDIGVPRIINTERAVAQSRHTLIILSPAWLVSEWAVFAGLLSQSIDPAAHDRRILPLLLQVCEPPRRIALLHAADFTMPEHREAQFQRVVAAIKGNFHLSDLSAPLSVMLGPEGRNRRAMLRKVRTIWIDGLLHHSLYQETLIALGLHEYPDAVARPLDVLVQRPDCANKPLPPDKRIIDVFDECDGALLILGAPGAGKTTLLLDLARDLLGRAEQDATYPIPVVFPLTSWAERRLPLADWLVDELVKRYDVPHKLAQSWIATDTILPLLDGLDEVRVEGRRPYVEVINTYRQAHGLLPLVVSSRFAEYEALSLKLRLHSAIVIQPLTRDQVKNYLRQIGIHVTPSSSSPFWEVLNSPLMLNIATLTYAGQDGQHLPTDGTAVEQRYHLFTAYVARMFKRRPASQHFSQDCSLHWLSWLAWQLQHHNQTVFYLEHLQPEWLPTQMARWQYVLLDRGLVGLLVGLLVGMISVLGFGLIYGLVVMLVGTLVVNLFGGRLDIGQPMVQRIQSALLGMVSAGVVSGIISGMSLALVGTLGVSWGSEQIDPLGFGLMIGLFGALFGALAGVLAGAPHIQPRRITPVEVLSWSWSRAWYSTLIGLSSGVAIGLVFWLILNSIAYSDDLVKGIVNALVDTLGTGLILGLGIGMIGGLTSSNVEQKVRPNQGIRRSARNALISGLVGGVSFGLFVGLVGGNFSGLVNGIFNGLIAGVVVGLGSGLVIGLSNGGYACISHAALRIILSRKGAMPLAYVRFLDFAAQRILLRNVGGGYIFIHRMLLDHFAAQYKGPETAEVNATSKST